MFYTKKAVLFGTLRLTNKTSDTHLYRFLNFFNKIIIVFNMVTFIDKILHKKIKFGAYIYSSARFIPYRKGRTTLFLWYIIEKVPVKPKTSSIIFD